MDVTTRFLEFFESRDHRLLQGSSLVPRDGDPVLFTTSGMHPLTPYLEGRRPHPQGGRLAGIQRCLRTTDLDEVGDDIHLTVFQMLGSWSLGDYEGPQSLRWGYELLADGFGVGTDRLHATVFGGDGQVPADVDSLRTWTELGVPVELTDGNWWSNGPVGPCGPDSEIFVWTGAGPPQGTPGTDGRWMELWNHVTLRYRRRDDGSLEPLPQRSVDTGMGLERLLMIAQGKPSVFDCDVFEPWTSTLPGLWGTRSLRLLTDHLRASIVIIGDGVRPSNTGRGYVLRRLVRRVLTELWREDRTRSLDELPAELFDHTLLQFGLDADVDRDVVRNVLRGEEKRFGGLLDRGRKVLARYEPGEPLTRKDLAYLHETHGLPPELITELLA